MLGAILDQAVSISVSADDLVLSFAGDAASLVRPLQRQESLELIQREAAKVLGRTLHARVDVAAGAERPRPEAPGGKQLATHDTAEAPTRGPSRGTLLERATGEPGVKKLLREFGAQIVDIEPLEPTADPGSRPLPPPPEETR
jgi:hypothetical protein